MTAVLLAAGIAIGIALGDDPTAVFTLVFLIVYLTGVLIFYLIALQLRERLVSESVRELENQFADMPLEQAARKLIKQGIITENGFICRFIPLVEIRCNLRKNIRSTARYLIL